MEITIAETAVGEIDGIRVGVANVWSEDYDLDDGTPQHGPRATLAVMGTTPETDFDVRVHPGTVVRIGSVNVEVTSIYEPEGAPGSVTLRQRPAPDQPS